MEAITALRSTSACSACSAPARRRSAILRSRSGSDAEVGPIPASCAASSSARGNSRAMSSPASPATIAIVSPLQPCAWSSHRPEVRLTATASRERGPHAGHILVRNSEPTRRPFTPKCSSTVAGRSASRTSAPSIRRASADMATPAGRAVDLDRGARRDVERDPQLDDAGVLRRAPHGLRGDRERPARRRRAACGSSRPSRA